MNFIDNLKQEHNDIERELLELETIIDSEEINYPNLVHVYQKLHDIWNRHEKKEDAIFPILKNEKIIIPVEKMLFEHKELNKHRVALVDAINSGNNAKVKEALDTHLRIMIGKLREHMSLEDEILFRITLENFTEEEIKEAEKILQET